MLKWKKTQISEKDKASEPPTSNTPGSISKRKIESNRQNAKKSTGPRTERGKRNSAFNAIRHGLLMKRIPDTDLKGLEVFVYSLSQEYGDHCDLRHEVLKELATLEYWRLKRGLIAEGSSIGSDEQSVPGVTQLVLRYNKAARHSLMRTLEQLEQFRDARIRELELEEQEIEDTDPEFVESTGENAKRTDDKETS